MPATLKPFALKSFVKPVVMAAALVVAGSLTACNKNSDAAETPQTAPKVSTAAAQNSQSTTKTSQSELDAIAKALSDNLAKSGVESKILAIKDTKMPNIYMAVLDGMPPVFTDKTGQYIIQGQIIQVGGTTPVDISSEMNAELAKAELDAVPTSEMIIFPAKGKKLTHIYVFSDPTCHYCQLLHKEIDKTTSAGVEVRYLAWPRSEQVVPMTEAIWCSKDRQDALTRAKADIQSAVNELASVPSCPNPVKKHMALGFKLGVSGTPAVFAANGKQIGGYLPSEQLAKVAIDNNQ